MHQHELGELAREVLADNRANDRLRLIAIAAHGSGLPAHEAKMLLRRIRRALIKLAATAVAQLEVVDQAQESPDKFLK